MDRMRGRWKKPGPLGAALLLTAMTSLWLTLVAGGAAADTAHVTEFRLPMVPSYAQGLVGGPDGEMWFAASYVHDFVPGRGGELVREVDRISVDGQVSAVASPLAVSAFISGPEDSVWLIHESHSIDRLGADGKVTEFPLETRFPTTNTVPEAIAEGPDGNIWFTGLHYLGNVGGPPESVEVIGRLTPAGQVSEYPLSGKELGLTAITAGSDGSVWFTEHNANRIGRITPTGEVTESEIPTDEARPFDIVAGPDGDLWFTEQRLSPRAAIGRIDPSGRITEFPLSGSSAYPGQIVSGPDGRLWFTDGVGAVGTIAPNGHSTRIALPHNTQVRAIDPGPEGDVWYTADGDSPCLGGGYACSMEIPKDPGIVGRIEPAPLSVALVGSRAVFHGRQAKLKLACSGGDVGDLCRGALRLTARIDVGTGAHGQRDRWRTALLAKRRYALPTDKTRTIGLGLRNMRLLLSLRGPRLPVVARLTTGEGETITRRLVLVSSATRQSRDHPHPR